MKKIFFVPLMLAVISLFSSCIIMFPSEYDWEQTGYEVEQECQNSTGRVVFDNCTSYASTIEKITRKKSGSSMWYTCWKPNSTPGDTCYADLDAGVYDFEIYVKDTRYYRSEIVTVPNVRIVAGNKTRITIK